MSIDVQEISLDISKQPDVQAVWLGQGDANGTQLVVSVFDDGIPKSLNMYSVRLNVHLPNDGGWYSVNGTRSGNVATFDVDETYAAAVAGENGFGYVDVLDGDEIICSTSRFQLVVRRSAQDGVDPATAYSNEIEELIGRVYEALEAMGDISELAVPLMTPDIRGGAKLGSGLEITDGALNVELPTMDYNVKGAAKLGTGLAMSGEALSVDASAVDAGTLSVAHGGTGLTASPSMLADLGSTTAAAVMAASPRPGVTGMLPVAHGGTGAFTASGALSNILDGSPIDVDGQAVGIGRAAPENGLEVGYPATFDADVTSYGNVRIEDKTIKMESPNIDRNGSDPSSTQYSKFLQFDDKDGDRVGLVFVARETDGRSRMSLNVYNDDGGAEVNNSISMYVAKDGTRTYGVANPAAFCSALHVGDYVTNSASSVSTATSTYKDLFNFTLAAGTWLVFVTMEFATNATGRRVAYLNTTAGGAGISLQWRSTETGVSGGPTRAKLAGVLIPSASTKYYVTGWQNSGDNLNLSAVAQAVRIK